MSVPITTVRSIQSSGLAIVALPGRYLGRCIIPLDGVPRPSAGRVASLAHEHAVRSRVKRGTLQAERESGTVHVLLDADRPATGEPTSQPDQDSKDELIAVLREQLAAEREANRENRRLLLAALERPVRGLEAGTEEGPPEESEGPETGARRPDRGYPWWRFWGS
jgi:hypothetical protein